MHEIALDVRISICIPENKKITVGNIAACVKESKIESNIAEQVIQFVDTEQVNKLCGVKNARGNKSNIYQRAGTTQRNPVTSVGELNLRIHKVKNTATGKTFKPVDDVINFDGKKRYQEDISMIGVELSTKMTYRDASKEAKLFINDFPSASTLNSRVIEYGELIKESNDNEIQGAGIDTVFADGTKTHSQEKDTKKNEVNVVLGVKDGHKVLMDLRVNQSWEESSKHLDNHGAVGKRAAIIGDGEKEMRYALLKEDRKYQMDFIHTFRIAGFKLWEDKEMNLPERKATVKRVEAILYPLKNSVSKHLNDGDMGALEKRINNTVDDLKKIAKELANLGCSKTAKFIRYYSNYVVTFAKLALEGRKVPWNSNIIERLMGEISKRCKHKWMKWTTKGLEAILRFILTRYTNEKIYENFKNKIMKNDNLKFISCEIKIGGVGGKL